MIGFINLYTLSFAWLLLAVPTGIALVSFLRQRKKGDQQPGCQTGCLFLCIPLTILFAAFIITGQVMNSFNHRPENLLKNFLGITNAEEIRNLTGEFDSIGIDYTVRIYFEADESEVRSIIEQAGFELKLSQLPRGVTGTVRVDFEGAPALPPDGETAVYERVSPSNNNRETLYTDKAHQRVWFVSIDI